MISDPSNKWRKKINNGVWLYEMGKGVVEVRHECVGDGWLGRMKLRDNEEGPVYWCCNCGYTLDNGEAMAIRLYEAPF